MFLILVHLANLPKFQFCQCVTPRTEKFTPKALHHQRALLKLYELRVS